MLDVFDTVVLNRATRRKVSLMLFGKDRKVAPTKAAAKNVKVVDVRDLEAWKARLTWIPGHS